MLLKHSALYLVARGLPGIINLAALALFTRLLAPEDYGRYALIVASAGLVGSLSFQWLQLALLRFLAAEREREDVFLSTVMAGFLGAMVISAAVAGIGLLFTDDRTWNDLFLVGLVLLWSQSFFDLSQELVRSRLSPFAYGVAAITKALLTVGVGWLAVRAGLGATGLIFGMIAGFALPLLWLVPCNWLVVRAKLVDWDVLRRLIAYGMPLTITFAFAFIINSSDRFLLAWLLNEDSAGLYSVGYSFAQHTLLMLMMVVNLAAYPLAVRSLEDYGPDAARQQLARNGRMLFSIACPAAAGMALLASNISGVFLGESFRGAAAEVIPWIALGALLSGLKAYHLDLSFQLGRRTVHQVWVVAAAALVNLVLNVWWIPLYGLLGSAYATVVAYFVALLLSWRIGNRIFPIPLPGGMVKTLIATLAMSLALLPIRDERGVIMLVVQVLLGALVYGALNLSLQWGDLRGARRAGAARMPG